MTDTLNTFIAGHEVSHPVDAPVALHSPVNLQAYARLGDASPATIEAAVVDAHTAFRRHRTAPLHQRITWLNAAAQAIEAAADELVALIIHDIGKPRRAASFEVQRSAQFFRACAATASTLGGETVPVDAVANVLLAALVDADEADAPRHWSEVRQLVGRIVDRAVDHALADYCNIADSAETQDRLGLR